MEPFEVKHFPDNQRFEVDLDHSQAILSYTISGERMVISHTTVPQAMEGQGIGSALVKTALDYARAQNLKVVPLCSFTDAYIQRHPAYQDLVAD